MSAIVPRNLLTILSPCGERVHSQIMTSSSILDSAEAWSIIAGLLFAR
jgi:hypothetical protein